MDVTLIQMVQTIGIIGVLALGVIGYIRDRGKAESKQENTLSDIAGNNSRELTEVHKQIGDIRQELGRAQGQNIVLMDNLKTVEAKREASEVVMKDKIFILQETVNRQTATISRHEGRIAELETESKRKDEIISAKEKEIVELTVINTRLQSTVDNQAIELDRLNKSVQLVTRAQSLDDTIQFTEEEIASLADPVPTVAIIEVPKPVTKEDNKDAA